MSERAAKCVEKAPITRDAVRTDERGQSSASGLQQSLLALQRSAGNRAVTNLLKRSSGRPLNPRIREEMEAKFGEDFRDVRVHRDRTAHTVASLVGARALTSGKEIVFGEDFYAPNSSKGKRLLAHELAHVVQQGRGRGSTSSAGVAEAEARTAGTNVESGKSATVAAFAGAGAQLDPLNDEERRRQETANMLPSELRESLLKAGIGTPTAVPPAAVKSPPPQIVVPGMNQEDTPGPIKWLGAPPIKIQLQQRKERTAAKEMPAPSGRSGAGDPGDAANGGLPFALPDGLVYVKDPEPTAFEKQLETGKEFQIKVHPKPDIDPRNVTWIGERPSDDRLKRSRFSDPNNASAKIWVDEGQSVDITVRSDAVMPIRDFKTHQLLGYRYRQGDTMTVLDRNGEIRGSRNLEKPLEHPPIDPIDVAMLGADVGPLAAKGLQAGGKAVLKALTKTGTRDLGEFGAEEASTVLAREATDAVETGASQTRDLGEIKLDVEPHGNTQPFETPSIQPGQHVLPDEAGMRVLSTESSVAPSIPKPATPPAPAPNPTKEVEALFHRKAELSAASKMTSEHGGEALDLNVVGKSNFAGLDVVSEGEMASVKAYTGETRMVRYMNDLKELCGGRGPMGAGSKVSKTVKDITRLQKQMKAAGKSVPLPEQYEADPAGFIERNATVRIPDNDVSALREEIVKDLTNPAHPYGYQGYGLDKALTAEEAREFAARRIKGVGQNIDQLLPKM